MQQLGNGLHHAKHHEEELSVREAELATMRRIGAPEAHILMAQSNLANAYQSLGRLEPALLLMRDVYFGRLKLSGEENKSTLRLANNYASSLIKLKRFEEAKSLFRKTIPVARRVLGESNHLTLVMKLHYAMALYKDDDATLDDRREAVGTLEETALTARRVLGGAHPLVEGIEKSLRTARAALAARETPSPGSA